MGKEDVDYDRSVLIVWDMQNGIAGNARNLDQLLQNVRMLIDASHASSVPVIYSQHTGLPQSSRASTCVTCFKDGAYLKAQHSWLKEAKNGE